MKKTSHVIPSVGRYPPGREFAEMFIVLKDANFLPRLKGEWSKSLIRLENMEVVAYICRSDNSPQRFPAADFRVAMRIGWIALYCIIKQWFINMKQGSGLKEVNVF